MLCGIISVLVQNGITRAFKKILDELLLLLYIVDLGWSIKIHNLKFITHSLECHIFQEEIILSKWNHIAIYGKLN